MADKTTVPSLRKAQPTVPLGAKPIPMSGPQVVSTRQKPTAPSAELIARVTASRPPVRTPQGPATVNADADDIGLEANVPLLPGTMKARRLDGGRDFNQLTAFEQQQLAEVGITPDMELPANMAATLREIREEMEAEAPPLMQRDPTKPLVIPEAVPIEKRSPEHRARLMKILGKNIKQEATAREEAERASRVDLPEGADEAFAMADAMVKGEAVDDVTPKTAAPAAKPTPADAPSQTGAAAHPPLCPHCSWPYALPDIPEPPYEKKLAFLQCALGEQTYKDEYEILGGNVTVAFRSLTTKELQAVFQQAFLDLKKGRIETKLDYDERLNWYRLCLQLLSLRGITGMAHYLPDGMSPATNDGAKACWDCDDPAEGETVLPQIASFIESNVLKTEQMFRMVSQECNLFNRTIAKLEANLDNSDFWKPTAGPA